MRRTAVLIDSVFSTVTVSKMLNGRLRTQKPTLLQHSQDTFCVFPGTLYTKLERRSVNDCICIVLVCNRTSCRKKSIWTMTVTK
jgi:hypothetical protein